MGVGMSVVVDGGLCEDAHRAFRCAVAGVAVRAPDEAHNRGDVDNRAAAGLGHFGCRKRSAQEHTGGQIAVAQCELTNSAVMVVGKVDDTLGNGLLHATHTILVFAWFHG